MAVIGTAGFEGSRQAGSFTAAEWQSVCGGMGSIRVSVWGPDSSGFSLHQDLLHACLTVYCPPTPPPPLLTRLHTHIYHSSKTTRTYVAHKHENIHDWTLAESCIFWSADLTDQSLISAHTSYLFWTLLHGPAPLEKWLKIVSSLKHMSPLGASPLWLVPPRPTHTSAASTHCRGLISGLGLRHCPPPPQPWPPSSPVQMCQETDWCSFQMQFPAIKHFVMIKSDWADACWWYLDSGAECPSLSAALRSTGNCRGAVFMAS